MEYVSANPTGPLTIGHARNAVLGDVIANLLDATGHDVTREFYLNDAGNQVDVLARAAPIYDIARPLVSRSLFLKDAILAPI